jgi:hypothetical protein
VSLKMPQWISSASEELDHFQNGLTTTSSSAFAMSTFHLTMPGGGNGAKPLQKMVVGSSHEVDTGIKVKQCQTIFRLNLTKTLLVRLKTIQRLQSVRQMTHFSPTVTLTLMLFQRNWVYPGKPQKQFPLMIRYPTWVLTGISPYAWFQSHRQKGQNTRRRLRNGYRNRLTPWMRYKSFMESSFTSALSYQQDMLTSPTWRPCWGCSVQILSCHITPLKTQPKTSHCGSTFSPTLKSLGASLVHALLQTEVLSQMPAQASGLALLPEGGTLGALSLVGKEKVATSGGQKLLASSFLSTLSSQSAHQGSILKSSATIKGLSKAGGKEEVETKRQIMSSGESTTSRLFTSALLSHVTSPAKQIQPMNPHVAFTPQHPCYYQPSTSLRISGNLSSTMIANLFPVSAISRLAETPLNPSQNPNEISTTMTQKSNSIPSTTLNRSRPSNPSNRPRPHESRIQNPPPILQTVSTARPSAYSPRLTPNPSVLRPHCLARDRLHLWKPFISHISRCHANLSEEDINCIFNVMSNAWSQSTHEAYSSGLLAWHVHCDKRSVPESLRAPAHHSYIASFMASLAGSYSGSTVSNYLYGLRAWHILHSVEWKLNALEIEALLKGAARLAPDSSKRKQRQPYTPEFITKVGEQLDLTDHLDASVYACLTDGFYSVARVGELTVSRLNAFDPAKHVTPANLCTEANQNGMEVTVLRVPSTKAALLEDEDIYWSHQPLQGHGIRIGATLHYLLRGVPFEAVKAMGRWSSDAFLRYLQKHAQILMLYIQADPDIHCTFSHFIMPTQAMLQGRQ